MTTRPRSAPTEAARSAWADLAWPILAGATVALGAAGVVITYGLLGVALIGPGMWIFLAVVIFGILTDAGWTLGRCVRVSGWSAVVVLSLVGVFAVLPAAGWFVAVAVGASSPPVTSRAAWALRRTQARRRRPPGADRAVDQAAVDRAFAEITARFTDDR